MSPETKQSSIGKIDAAFPNACAKAIGLEIARRQGIQP
jgi:hypothetical protein